MKKLQILNEWIKRCVEFGEWQNHYDLHIDEVYGKTSREIWIQEGLELLQLANNIVDKNKYVLYLQIYIKVINIKDDDVVIFEKLSAIDLSATPPSLYIYPKAWRPLEIILSDERKISENGDYKFFLSKSIENEDLYRFIDVLPL